MNNKIKSSNIDYRKYYLENRFLEDKKKFRINLNFTIYPIYEKTKILKKKPHIRFISDRKTNKLIDTESWNRAKLNVKTKKPPTVDNEKDSDFEKFIEHVFHYTL